MPHQKRQQYTQQLGRQQSGVSLIETLVALAIFALTVVIGISSLDNNLANLTRLNHAQKARLLAQNTAVDVQLGLTSSNNREQKIVFAAQAWSVQLKSEQTTRENIKRVVISIHAKKSSPRLASQTVFIEGEPNVR